MRDRFDLIRADPECVGTGMCPPAFVRVDKECKCAARIDLDLTKQIDKRTTKDNHDGVPVASLVSFSRILIIEKSRSREGERRVVRCEAIAFPFA